MSILNEAAAVSGPDSTYQVTVTTAVVIQVPTELIGQYVRLSTHDASIQYHFAASATGSVVAEDQASSTSGSGTAGSPYVLTVHANSGERLESGTHTDFVIAPNWTHVGVIAEDSGTAEVTLRRAQLAY